MAFDFKIEDYHLENHVRFVLNSHFDDVFETSDSYNIRCNVCGDSKKDKYKKRGFILKTKDPWVYYCHNCQYSTTVVSWLKEYFPVSYKNLMIDVMKQKREAEGNSGRYDFNKKKGASERDEKKDTEGFKSLLKFQDCVDYCESRKIPKEVYSKWFFCTSGIYKGRIIITFRNNKKKDRTYYYQARAFDDKSKRGMKYLSRFGDHNAIYNFYNVDKDKPVSVLEGPIDSEFVDNSIAVTGLKLKGEELKHFPLLRFILDNDKSGKKSSVKLLKLKKYVFKWDEFLKKYNCDGEVKDVNDFILKNRDGITKLTWDIIEPFFTNKLNDKIHFSTPREVKQKV